MSQESQLVLVAQQAWSSKASLRLESRLDAPCAEYSGSAMSMAVRHPTVGRIRVPPRHRMLVQTTRPATSPNSYLAGGPAVRQLASAAQTTIGADRSR